jgi:2-isopropylmalate synthase
MSAQNAFAHKGGLHASAVEKDPRSTSTSTAGMVGNRRHIVVSDQAGPLQPARAASPRLGLEVAPDDPKRRRAARRPVKEREAQGFAYDGAEASFELLARRALGQSPTTSRSASASSTSAASTRGASW